MRNFIINLLKNNFPEFCPEGLAREIEALLTRHKGSIFAIELPINKS